MNKKLHHGILIAITLPLLVFASLWSYEVYQLSNQRAALKKDYSIVNNITRGLLSVEAWKNHLIKIVTHRIDEFELTTDQEKLIKLELEQVLHAVINKADSLIHKKQKTIKGKLRKFAINSLVSEDKIHAQVPIFSQTILNEIKKPENKERMKSLILEKLEEFGSITYVNANDIAKINNILSKHSITKLEDFNHYCESGFLEMDQKMYLYTFMIIGIIFIFLILWWLYRKQFFLHNQLFITSVLLAIVILIVGLTSPMIEIDARIKEMTFILIGEQISFNDQVIFFESKSIVNVVQVLIETGKWDSIAVGILILAFSILFPFAKLISSKLYLISPSWRKNKFIEFFALKSGKWSMADVYVVAIFMAYIGFKGILDSQLNHLNMKTDSLASISTNDTTLQPGFILFVAFVLFSMVLSPILQNIKTRIAPI